MQEIHGYEHLQGISGTALSHFAQLMKGKLCSIWQAFTITSQLS